MLDVCFNDSVKGALKIAQHCGNETGRVASIAYISDKKGFFSFFAKRKAIKEYKMRQAELQKQAVSLGGNSKDVIGISFVLSEGEIDAPYEFWRDCMDDLERLKAEPVKIRLWVDHTPDAQCGLLFVADLLKDSKTEISIVELPEKIRKEEHCEIEYRGWGEVEPQLFGTFLNREKLLTEQEIKEMSDRWQSLKIQNAPLRVMEHGVVVSADESYYDELIRKEFPRDTCKIAQIIGNALVRQKILTGDVFIAKRIQTFIDNGELVVLRSSSDGFYGTIVECAK